MSIKSPIVRFLYRVIAAWKIITYQHKHYIIISMDRKNIRLFFDERAKESAEINVSFNGLQNYTAITIIKQVAENYDDVDMMLYKAEWEAGLDEYLKKTQE